MAFLASNNVPLASTTVLLEVAGTTGKILASDTKALLFTIGNNQFLFISGDVFPFDYLVDIEPSDGSQTFRMITSNEATGKFDYIIIQGFELEFVELAAQINQISSSGGNIASDKGMKSLPFQKTFVASGQGADVSLISHAEHVSKALGFLYKQAEGSIFFESIANGQITETSNSGLPPGAKPLEAYLTHVSQVNSILYKGGPGMRYMEASVASQVQEVHSIFDITLTKKYLVAFDVKHWYNSGGKANARLALKSDSTTLNRTEVPWAMIGGLHVYLEALPSGQFTEADGGKDKVHYLESNPAQNTWVRNGSNLIAFMTSNISHETTSGSAMDNFLFMLPDTAIGNTTRTRSGYDSTIRLSGNCFLNTKSDENILNAIYSLSSAPITNTYSTTKMNGKWVLRVSSEIGQSTGSQYYNYVWMETSSKIGQKSGTESKGTKLGVVTLICVTDPSIEMYNKELACSIN